MENRSKLRLSVFQESDYGPKSQHIEKLTALGAKKRQISRWFNAVSCEIDNQEILEKIKKMDEVYSVFKFGHDLILTNNRIPKNELNVGWGIAQLGASDFADAQLHGIGVNIGVIDGGFLDATQSPMLSHLFESGRIKATKDFFFPDKKDFFGEKKSDQEFHGTAVLGFIGGYNPKESQWTGLAVGANFFLARTESSTREARIEEDHWIASIEWLDSLGVRLVNSSLGYAQGFTNPAENYQPEQMDGKTSLIAKGAAIAVNQKGMIIVSSAGNEGENKVWGGIVSTPGDVEEVISVGANDENGLKMSYSSKGNENIDFVKPDVTAYSQYGTSFAAPLITGFIACLLQEYPYLNSQEVKTALRLGADISDFPNNYVGVGFPKAKETLAYLKKNMGFNDKPIVQITKKSTYKFQSQVPVAVFHYKDSKNILDQQLLKPLKNACQVFKPQKAVKSIVILPEKILEINWK